VNEILSITKFRILLKKDLFSKHNSSYWLGTKYLGIGPSAHSYNGIQRGWNISNNAVYIQKIDSGIICHETRKF